MNYINIMVAILSGFGGAIAVTLLKRTYETHDKNESDAASVKVAQIGADVEFGKLWFPRIEHLEAQVGALQEELAKTKQAHAHCEATTQSLRNELEILKSQINGGL